MLPRPPKRFRPPAELDELRHPIARRHQGREPLDRGHASGARHAPRAPSAIASMRRRSSRDEVPAALRRAERLGHAPDVVEDVRETSGIQRRQARAARRPAGERRLHVLERDGADLALDLRHDVRRRELAKPLRVHAIDRKRLARAARSPSGGSRPSRRADRRFGSVQTGSSSTPSGKSHSCERPTSASAKPSAATISVAEGSSETIRGPLMQPASRAGRDVARRRSRPAHDAPRRTTSTGARNIGPPVTHV